LQDEFGNGGGIVHDISNPEKGFRFLRQGHEPDQQGGDSDSNAFCCACGWKAKFHSKPPVILRKNTKKRRKSTGRRITAAMMSGKSRDLT
jgi:hypothetical protein